RDAQRYRAAEQRPEELVDDVRERRSPPREQRADAGQRQQDETDRDEPLVEERPGDGETLAGDRFAQRREHRAEQDEQRGEQQNPVVDEERRFARQPRVELVARLQERQPVDDQAEAEDQDRDHEPGEQPRQRRVLAERVHRLLDAGARQERAEDRQEEREDDE